MSAHIAKLNRKIRVNQALSRPWNVLYQNTIEEKTLKQKFKYAENYCDRRMKTKALGGWKNIFYENKKERDNSYTQ